MVMPQSLVMRCEQCDDDYAKFNLDGDEYVCVKYEDDFDVDWNGERYFSIVHDREPADPQIIAKWISEGLAEVASEHEKA